MVPSIIKVGFFIDWKVNQKEITEQYCINKNKPEKQCNGCCHYEKQIEKVEKATTNESNFPYSILSKNTVAEYIENPISNNILFQDAITYCIINKLEFKPFLFHYKMELIHGIFHPPSL